MNFIKQDFGLTEALIKMVCIYKFADKVGDDLG